jgi:hypothetical protein
LHMHSRVRLVNAYLAAPMHGMGRHQSIPRPPRDRFCPQDQCTYCVALFSVFLVRFRPQTGPGCCLYAATVCVVSIYATSPSLSPIYSHHHHRQVHLTSFPFVLFGVGKCTLNSTNTTTPPTLPPRKCYYKAAPCPALT